MLRSAVLAIPLLLVVALGAYGGPYAPWSGPYAYDSAYPCPAPKPYSRLAASAASAAASASAAAAAASITAATARYLHLPQSPRYSLPLLWTDVIRGGNAPSVRHGGYWGGR